MMEIEWLLVKYTVKQGKMLSIYEAIDNIKVFNSLKFSESIKGVVKNMSFLRFSITKGCDIRYYANFRKVKKYEYENFKNKFLLTLSSDVNVFNPSKSNTETQSGCGLTLAIGSYDSAKDAIQSAQDISNGFINSLLNGGENFNFAKESKKLLVEKRDALYFVGSPQKK